MLHMTYEICLIDNKPWQFFAAYFASIRATFHTSPDPVLSVVSAKESPPGLVAPSALHQLHHTQPVVIPHSLSLIGFLYRSIDLRGRIC